MRVRSSRTAVEEAPEALIGTAVDAPDAHELQTTILICISGRHARAMPLCRASCSRQTHPLKHRLKPLCESVLVMFLRLFLAWCDTFSTWFVLSMIPRRPLGHVPNRVQYCVCLRMHCLADDVMEAKLLTLLCTGRDTSCCPWTYSCCILQPYNQGRPR